MTLTTDDLGNVPDIDAVTLDEFLATDAFGKFAILTAPGGEYIQAGNDWEPGEVCAAFLSAHDSDPWVLEYREGGQQFRATGHVALSQVRQAFRDYLGGTQDWRSASTWTLIRV